MSKNQGNNEAPTEGASFREKSPAQSKWDELRGEEFCYVAETLSRGKRSKVYVYELVYRVDLLEKDDPMLMVKAIREGEAVVAFIYSPGLLTGMSNLAGLFRSGSLKWREDGYPSGKFKKMLAMDQGK